MKVALLRDFPEENWPSIEVYADRLAQGLWAAAPDLDLTEVRIRAWSWAARSFPTPYGRPASLHSLGLYLSRLIRYPLLLRRIQADVYHVLDNSYGHLALFLDPRKTVVTSHGGTPRSWRRWNPEGPAMWLFDLAFRGMLWAANIVIVSEYSKRELLAEANYPAARIHVIYHGIEPIFSPLPEAARMAKRASLLGPQDCHLLLHVGHSAARKNVETLYQALAVLRREGRAVRLVRIGGMPTPAQARLIQELDLTTVVTHIPYVPNRELPSYYAAADAFVFPSLYEGFGVPLIEAMACGTPVVCSDWELFREVCGDAARFFDARRPETLAEAVEHLLGDPAAVRSMQRLGLERASNFTWEQTARKTLDVYRQMASGN